MKGPIVGLTPLVDTERDSYWMLPGYMEGVAQAGGIPIMLPLTADREQISRLAELCDAFLFTGGQDVAPELYGEERVPACGEIARERDRMEQRLLDEVLRMDKPLLGICRGIQFLNAALGGTLYQDLPTQRPTPLEHHQCPPYEKPVHRVELLPGTPLRELLQKETLDVNSYHHQGVCRVAPELRVMAAAEDGLAEGLYMPGKRFVWAVQWHPEFSWKTDADSRKIFSALIEAARL